MKIYLVILAVFFLTISHINALSISSNKDDITLYEKETRTSLLNHKVIMLPGIKESLKLRTNLLGSLFGIMNLGVEYLFTDKYSIEANFWKADLGGDEILDYDYTKFGIMVRKYLSNYKFYLGVGAGILDAKTSLIGITTDAEFFVMDLKIGKDFKISKHLDMGVSFGYVVNLSDDYSDENGEITAFSFANLGVNGIFKF